MTSAAGTVRVFVSSTFRDMHAERDHLVRFVFPDIERRCRRIALHFVPVDLRWGVTRKELEQRGAVGICRAEIDACRPLFIGLLGERYGWRPLPDVVPDACARRLDPRARVLFEQAYTPNPSFDEWLLVRDGRRRALWGSATEACEAELLKRLAAAGMAAAGRSVTAEEVHHGVFDGDASGALLFLRDRALTDVLAGRSNAPEDFYESSADARARLAALKRELLARELAVSRYGDLDAFGEVVRDRLWQLIEALCVPADTGPRAIPPAHSSDQSPFVQRLTRCFVGRDAELEALDALALAPGGYACVSGPSGTGKTALLANWLYGSVGMPGFAARHPHVNVVSHFVGANPGTADLRQLLVRLCTALAAPDERPNLPADVDALAALLSEHFAQAASRGPVVVVIDALDQLEATDNAPALDWLPRALPEGASVIASVPAEVADAPWNVMRAWAGERMLAVEPLGSADVPAFVTAYLARYRKRLEDDEIASLGAKAQARNPLYLETALEELRTFGDYDGLGAYIDALPETVSGLYAFMLAHLEREHGDAFVGRVLRGLACGRNGMTDAELLTLGAQTGARVPALKWARLEQTLAPHLVRRGDTLAFYHRELREAVRQRYLADPVIRRDTHRRLAAYFDRQPLTVRRRLEEQVFQQVRGEVPGEPLDTLGNFAFLAAKCDAGLVDGLLDDFALARRHQPRACAGLEPVERALALSANTLRSRPAELAAQLTGRLVGADGSTADRVICAAAGAASRTGLMPLSASLTRPGGPLVRSLHGHRSDLSALAIAPDGRTAVSACDDGTLQVWDVESGARLRRWPAHEGMVLALRFSAGGTLAASSGADRRVRLWSLREGRALQDWGHAGAGAARHLQFADDDAALVAACADPDWGGWSVTAYDVADGRVLRNVALRHRATVGAGEIDLSGFAMDRDVVVTSCTRNRLHLWDFRSGALVRRFEGHGDMVLGLAVHAAAGIVVSLARGESVTVRDLGARHPAQVLADDTGSLNAFALSADGCRIVTSAFDGTMRLWDRQRASLLQSWAVPARTTQHIALSRDATRALSFDVELDRGVRVWDLSRAPLPIGHSRGVADLCAIPGSARLLSASLDGTLRIWDLANGACLAVLKGHADGVVSVAVDASGATAVSGALDGSVRAWDLAGAASIGSFHGHQAAVTAVALTDDGTLAVSHGRDDEVRVWDVAARKLVRAFDGIRVFALLDGGALLALATQAHRLTLLDCRTLEPVGTWDPFVGDPGAIRSLRGSENGQFTVAILDDWTVSVRARDGSSGYAVPCPAYAVTTRDGRHVVSSERDGTARVFGVEDGGSMAVLPAVGGDIYTAALSADGSLMLAGDLYDTARLWDLGTCVEIGGFSSDAVPSQIVYVASQQLFVVGDDSGGVHFLRLCAVQDRAG